MNFSIMNFSYVEMLFIDFSKFNQNVLQFKIGIYKHNIVNIAFIMLTLIHAGGLLPFVEIL